MDIFKYIKPEHLKGEQRELAELIGIEAYCRIMEHYGGERLFISGIDRVISANRTELVRAAIGHENETEIIKLFHITKREFERIKLGCK